MKLEINDEMAPRLIQMVNDDRVEGDSMHDLVDLAIRLYSHLVNANLNGATIIVRLPGGKPYEIPVVKEA